MTATTKNELPGRVTTWRHPESIGWGERSQVPKTESCVILLTSIFKVGGVICDDGAELPGGGTWQGRGGVGVETIPWEPLPAPQAFWVVECSMQGSR